MVGKQSCFWYQNEPEDGFEHNEPFSASNIFLEKQIELQKPNDENKSDTASIGSNSSNLLNPNSLRRGSITSVISMLREGEGYLMSGTYNFPFKFRIADFFPAGTKKYPVTFEHELGEIKYFVSGVIERPYADFNFQTLSFIKIEKGLLKSNPEIAECFEPYRHEVVRYARGSLLNVSGLASQAESKIDPSVLSKLESILLLSVVCEKRAFKPGENIVLDIVCKNDSTTKKLSKLTAKLVCTMRFSAKEPTEQLKTVTEEVCSCKHTHFESSRDSVVKGLTMHLPATNVPPTISDRSSIVQCIYELKVALTCASKFLRALDTTNVQLSIPIYVYNQDHE